MSTLKRRMDSSVPTAADRARLKRRMNSPVSRSDSSSEPCKGCDCDLMATLPLWGGGFPALIVGLCNLFEISPSQLNPPAWRVHLGDLEYLSLGINEVMFAYHLAPLNGGERLFHLHPRSGLPIVEELPKSDRKGPVFNKKWPERYTFMRTHPAPAEGERAVIRARQLPIDRRQVNFLVRNMAGGVANDPFTAYQEAAKVMSAKKGSSSRSASRDEVVITGSRRSTVVKLGPSPSLPEKRPKSGGMTTRSAQQSADMARSAGSLAVTLSNVNLNVFPQDGTVLSIGDPSEVVQVLQGGLLWTVSQLYHLGERLFSEGLPTLREEIEDLKSQVSGERDQRAARELEIRDLKDKLEEEIDALKAAAETFKFEMLMAVNGARVVVRWELMREWLRKQSARWDLVTALEQYKVVVQEEARNKGAPPPTFEDQPPIPRVSNMDVDSSVKPRGSPT
ncbi:hypothetical protein HID58_079468 [Brassica napus]|uniref:Uncharacterized protein n=1 Tax=Brassica napus TaxID=3708 RepID=A0ABQ7Y3S6_BRANA|nr:hypothetical protein HID58_079468 [Brassica napus]